MTTCKVSKIIFNNGKEITLSSNDIVVFVGPNNAGKSRTLKDIYNSFSNNTDNIIVNDIEIDIQNPEDFIDTISRSSYQKTVNGRTSYKGYTYDFDNYDIDRFGKEAKIHRKLVPFFVSDIDTNLRLNQCQPTDIIDRDEPKKHPLHYIANDERYRNLISDNFDKAFGKKLQIEKYNTKKNYLRIGDIININAALPTVDANMERYERIMSSYPKVHEQGDGIKGFIGILLNIIMENYSVFLIDEPEAFLHQPQAKILGNEIAEILGDRQAFISTHSSAFIRGLLEVAPERLKIVRITRTDDNNHFHILNNTNIDDIWRDTLLKHSNILESLFYKNVVVCESDSDCQFYSIILSWIKEQEGRFPETLFVYSSTKNRLRVVAKALKSLNIDFRILPDIDILRKEDDDIQQLYTSCGGEWTNDLDNKFNEFNQYFEQEPLSIHAEELIQKFEKEIKNIGKKSITAHELKNIKSNVKLDDRWKIIKKGGIDAITEESVKDCFAFMDEKLREYGIYIVKVGELERFIPINGKIHGPKWVDRVLTDYPNLSEPIYDKVKEYINSLEL